MDRINHGEKLVAGSYVFGIEEKGKKVPLKGTFSNEMFAEVSHTLLEKKQSTALRTHSLRKGGSFLADGRH